MDTKNISAIVQMQTRILEDRMRSELENATTPEEIMSIKNRYAKKFFMSVGKPLTELFPAEAGHMPYAESHNAMAYQIVDDIDVLYRETELLGDYIVESFNYNQNEKTKLKNKIVYLSSLASNFNLVANEFQGNVVYFNESFNSYNNIDTEISTGSPINISTSEGVATLERTVAINHSPQGKIKIIAGNGDAGNYHIIDKMQTSTEGGIISITAKYASDDSPHDDPSAIIDGRPDTWFEYQMVNASDAAKAVARGYDIDWAKGKQRGERLRIKIVIELDSVRDINWIYINPYYPKNSTGKIHIYSLSTSRDGIEYKPINSEEIVMDNQVSVTPQSYTKDTLLVDDKQRKYNQQGVFSFPLTKAKFIEVVIDQPESYEETLGHTYYEKVVVKDDVIQPAKKVQDEVAAVFNIKPLRNAMRHIVTLEQNLSFEGQQQYVEYNWLAHSWTLKGYDFEPTTVRKRVVFYKNARDDGFEFIMCPAESYTKDQAVAKWQSMIGTTLNEIDGYKGEFVATEWGASPPDYKFNSIMETHIYPGRGYKMDAEAEREGNYTIGYNTYIKYVGYADVGGSKAEYRAVTCLVDQHHLASVMNPPKGRITIDNPRFDRGRILVDAIIIPNGLNDEDKFPEKTFAHIVYNGIEFKGEVRRIDGPYTYGIEIPYTDSNKYEKHPEEFEFYNELNHVFKTSEEAEQWVNTFRSAPKNGYTVRMPAEKGNYYSFEGMKLDTAVSINNPNIVAKMNVSNILIERIADLPLEEQEKYNGMDGEWRVKFIGGPNTIPMLGQNTVSATYVGVLSSEKIAGVPEDRVANAHGKSIAVEANSSTNPLTLPQTYTFEDDLYHGILELDESFVDGVHMNVLDTKVGPAYAERVYPGTVDEENENNRDEIVAMCESIIGTQMDGLEDPYDPDNPYSGMFTVNEYIIEEILVGDYLSFNVIFRGIGELSKVEYVPSYTGRYKGYVYLKALYDINGKEVRK